MEEMSPELKKAIEEIREANAIYYRVVKDSNDFRVVEMQWFDEFTFDHSKYAGDIKFETREEAEKYAFALLVVWSVLRY